MIFFEFWQKAPVNLITVSDLVTVCKQYEACQIPEFWERID